MNKKYPLQMEIAGPFCLWTRTDTGDSPVSYPAPTYSAVKGIFESVLWGPAIEIIPTKVEICKPLQWQSYVTNYGGPLRKTGTDNFQMFATVLTDVCYRLYAEVIPMPDKSRLPEKALQWDAKTTSPGHAYQAQFNRRLRKGQSFSSIFLGWKEFTPSYFGEFREETKVCTDIPDIHIPSMLRQTFSNGYASDFFPVFDTDIVIKNGTLIYPPRR